MMGKKISVEWLVDKDIFLPLSNAKIVIRDGTYFGEGEAKIIDKGQLDNEGKFTSKEKFPPKIVVEITSEFESSEAKSSFTVYGRPIEKKDEGKVIGEVHKSVFKFDITPSKEEYQCQIGKKEPTGSEITNLPNPWSVYQAMAKLVEVVENELGLSGDYKIHSYSSRSTSYHYTPVSAVDPFLGGIFIQDSDHLSWGAMAHELSHALNVLTEVGGAHGGLENQYDYISEAYLKSLNEQGRAIFDKYPDWQKARVSNSPCYKNKEKAIANAFGEGFTTWLGVILLNLIPNNFKLSKLGVNGSNFTLPNLSFDLNSNTEGVKKTDGTNTAAPYGEDAEFAISRLLWNITNKKEGKFERIQSKEQITNKIYIPLKTLFDKILNLRS